MNASSPGWLFACAASASLLSCASPATTPAATVDSRAASPSPEPAPKPVSAYERRWQSACEAQGATGSCPAPFDRPGLFFDVADESEQPPPSLCRAGDPATDGAARTALYQKQSALRVCFRGSERGAFIDFEPGGGKPPAASAGVSPRALACVAKIVERALPTGQDARAPKRVVVLNGGSARKGAATLSKESVHAVIAAHADEVSACYDGALEVWPGLRGRLAPSVVIWFDGSVALVRTQQSTLDNPALECCINTAVRGWRFDPPADGSIAIVNLPLSLGPQGP
jgi:hypothetical protein